MAGSAGGYATIESNSERSAFFSTGEVPSTSELKPSLAVKINGTAYQ